MDEERTMTMKFVIAAVVEMEETPEGRPTVDGLHDLEASVEEALLDVFSTHPTAGVMSAEAHIGLVARYPWPEETA